MAFYHMAVKSRHLVERLIERSITAIGYEVIETDDGRLPVLAAISEIAGQVTISLAMHLLRSSSGGRGIWLGGSPGLPPAHVVILGAGAWGPARRERPSAAGARVTLLDIDTEKLRHLIGHLPHVATGLADPDSIAAAVASADVVIGAVLVAGRKAPQVVTRHMVESMRRGSVIIDAAIDQGGCVETSHPTTLAEPTYLYHGVVHYCVPNLTADMSRSASMALAQAVLPYLRAHRGSTASRRRCRVPRTCGAAPIRTAAPACAAAWPRCSVLDARGGSPHGARMSWTDEYRARLRTGGRSAGRGQSGDRVYVHQGCGEPEDLVQAMVRRGPELRDVEVIHLATMGSADYAKPEFEGHFRVQRLLRRRQRAPGRAGGARRLHPHLPFTRSRSCSAAGPCPSTWR